MKTGMLEKEKKKRISLQDWIIHNIGNKMALHTAGILFHPFIQHQQFDICMQSRICTIFLILYFLVFLDFGGVTPFLECTNVGRTSQLSSLPELSEEYQCAQPM
jgi:hypothetical protein